MAIETTTSTEKPDPNLFGDEVQSQLGQAKEYCLNDPVCLKGFGVTAHTFEMKTNYGLFVHSVEPLLRSCHGEFIAAMEQDVQALIEMDPEAYYDLGYEDYDEDGDGAEIVVACELASPPRWFVEYLKATPEQCQQGYDKFIDHLLDPSVSPYPELVEHFINNDPLFDHVPGVLFSFSPALAIQNGFSPRYILNFCVALRSPRESNSKIAPYVMSKEGRLTRFNMLVCAAAHDCFQHSAGHSQFETWTVTKAKNFLEGKGHVRAMKSREVFGKTSVIGSEIGPEEALFDRRKCPKLQDKGLNPYAFAREPELQKLVEEYLEEKTNATT